MIICSPGANNNNKVKLLLDKRQHYIQKTILIQLHNHNKSLIDQWLVQSICCLHFVQIFINLPNFFKGIHVTHLPFMELSIFILGISRRELEVFKMMEGGLFHLRDTTIQHTCSFKTVLTSFFFVRPISAIGEARCWWFGEALFFHDN